VGLGFIEGAGFSVIGTAEALWEIAKSPKQFINGVNTLLNSAEARAQFGAEIIAGVKVDIQMLEDAFNSGDMRGVGQQLGKLTTDLAQVAGGVEALAKLGVSTASAGGRLLLRSVDDLAATRAISASKGGAASIDQAATGIQWKVGVKAQGMPWEDYLATKLPPEARLPKNFERLDFFDFETGVATSAKTLDTLTDAKLAKPSQIYTSLKGNIDKIADFETTTLSGVTVRVEQISQRVLAVAVPAGTTPAQWDQIAKAIQYGQSRGVVIKITEIKP
jgi:filamentous hemagglutinin